MNNYPHFCVVGHPNQGKSSIVSTLVENDSVEIGIESGTTQKNARFEFTIDGKLLLALTDTPGFQRSRQVLAWLQQDDISPAQRPNRIRAFLAEPEHAIRFPDEVQLLTPIMAGAGVIYITDAANQPTAADEAEMEILRWTGQPRMAVINPISQNVAHQQWQMTLNQFFQWVREFNPMTATLPARQVLLRAMAELSTDWTFLLDQLSRRLAERDQQRLAAVSLQLAHYWCEQVNRREPLSKLTALFSQTNSPEDYLQQRLDKAEGELFHQLAKNWGHGNTPLALNAAWDLDSDTLMNTENWYLWGLKQHDLLLASAAAGAAAGSLIDLGLGGASFMLGAVSGGIIGSTTGWLASKQLTGKRLGWIPLAGKKDYVGPVRHPNFPLVVMARALTFTQLLWLRPHAQRTRLTLQAQADDWSRPQQVQLLNWAKALQQNKWKAKQQQALSSWISEQLSTQLTAALNEEQRSAWRL